MDWSEEKIIQYMRNTFPAGNVTSVIGIGDDCAVFPKNEDESWLATTDAMIEGVHFLRLEMPPKDLGFKLVSVNVSDVASMGGTPNHMFLSMALPEDLDLEWFEAFIRGVKHGCEVYGVALLGGDTVRSMRDLFFNVMVLGSVKTSDLKLRHAARPGDHVFVTGPLGHAAAGLKSLQLGCFEDEGAICRQQFTKPCAHMEKGAWLGAQTGVHAMMDISDGLLRDARRLAKASGVGIQIDLDHLYISDELKKECKRFGWDPVELALTGGEDYVLLLTVNPAMVNHLEGAYLKEFSEPLRHIGTILEGEKGLKLVKNGRAFESPYLEFDHFIS